MFEFFKSLWREIWGPEIPVTIPVRDNLGPGLTIADPLAGHLTPYVPVDVQYTNQPLTLSDVSQIVSQENPVKRPPVWMSE